MNNIINGAVKNEMFRLMDEVVLPNMPEVLAHREKKLGKDIEKRFRWDLFWGSKVNQKMDFGAYKDSHIDTALKEYVRTRF